jgi:hypothetical protein
VNRKAERKEAAGQIEEEDLCGQDANFRRAHQEA